MYIYAVQMEYLDMKTDQLFYQILIDSDQNDRGRLETISVRMYFGSSVSLCHLVKDTCIDSLI